MRLRFSVQFLCTICFYLQLLKVVYCLEHDATNSKSSYFLKKPRHHKEGTSMSTFQVNDEFSCELLCLHDPNCYIANFEKAPKDGKKLHECQLFGLNNKGIIISSELFDLYIKEVPLSCTHAKSLGYDINTHYVIDPDGVSGDVRPFLVFCNMTSHYCIGVTVISHNSEKRTKVSGCNHKGCYRRDVVYDGISDLQQLRALTLISTYCEQFISYECKRTKIKVDTNSPFAWLVSRDGHKLRYWGGALRDSGKCACGMTNTCAETNNTCNCDANDKVWREDSGMISYKEDLPIITMRFGDAKGRLEEGFHSLGKLTCYGTGSCEDALGMQKKAIPDMKINASSEYNEHYRAHFARLNDNSNDGWASGTLNVGEWIQVDVSIVNIITAVATQGRRSGSEWVTSYSLQYSMDGRTFTNYQEGKLIDANSDATTIVKNDLRPPIIARYIRLIPKSYNGHMTLRMELYVCK